MQFEILKIDKEVRYLELLKKRFGEQDLQNCEVMIKDARDSLRTDRFVATDSTAKQNISVILMDFGLMVLMDFGRKF